MDQIINKSEEQKTRYSGGRVLMITIGGSILEYYNYSLFALASALIFSSQFFPNVSNEIGIIYSLATFGVGFLAQPIGSVLFSHIGDKIGRARSLFITMIILGIATICIDLIPNYATIGIAAPIILMFFRMLQGIGAGAEMSGSAIFGFENSQEKSRALYGSFTSMGSGIGALLGVMVFFLTSLIFGEQALHAWAWRIPFLLGSVILIFVMIARRGIVEEEKKDYEQKEQQNEIAEIPLLEVLRDHKWTFIKVTGVAMGYYAFAMLGATYFLSYISVLGFSDNVTMIAQILYQVIIIPFVPIVAMISDRWNRKAVISIGAVLNIVTMSAFFIIIPGSSAMTVYLLIIAVALTTTVMYGTLLTFLGEQFPTRVRYSGFGVAFAVGTAIGGGLSPSIAASIFTFSDGNVLLLSLFAFLLGLLVLFSTLGLKNHSQRKLSEIDGEYTTLDSRQKVSDSISSGS